MDVYRNPSFSATTTTSVSLAAPSPAPRCHLAGPTSEQPSNSPENTKNRANSLCPAPASAPEGSRTSSIRPPSSPRRDEQIPTDLVRNRPPEPPHARARAFAAASSFVMDSGRSPAFRPTSTLGLASPASKGPSPPFSAAVAAPDHPTRFTSPPRASLDRCRRTAQRQGTRPPPLGPSPAGDASSTDLVGHLPRGHCPRRPISPAASDFPVPPSAVTGRHSDTEPTPWIPPVSSGPAPNQSAAVSCCFPLGSLSLDELTGQPSGQLPQAGQPSGQLPQVGQISLLHRKTVTFQSSISSESSLAVSISMPLPADTPQSPSATAPVRDSFLAASHNAAPSTGHTQPPVLSNNFVAVSFSTPSSASAPQSPPATAPLRDTFLVASLPAAPSTGHLPPPVLTDATTTSTSGTSFQVALLNSQIHRSYNDPIAAAPTPIRKGELMTISISDDVYASRLHMFQTALIGRLILRPGDKPWTIDELKLKLQSLWHPIGGWRMTSLGKGYYSFKFGSIAERDRIRATILPPLKPGILKLFQWTPRFNPNDQKTSLAQVWVRFSNLSEEYYDHSVIWGLARCVGTPLKIDPRSLEGCYAHFARVLVEIDVSKEVETRVGIEHSNGLSIISAVSYERLPEYCHTCQAIGHSSGTCRKMLQQKPMAASAPEEKQTEVRASKQVWQVVTKKKAARPTTVSVSASLNHILGNLSSPSQDSKIQSAVPQPSIITTAPVASDTTYDSSFIDRTVPPDPRLSYHLPHSSFFTTTPVASSTAWADMADEASQSSEEDNTGVEEIIVDDIRGMLENTIQCVEAREEADSAVLDHSGSQLISDSLAMIPICTVSPIQVSPHTSVCQVDVTTKTNSPTQSPSSKKKRSSKRLARNWR